MWPVSKKKRRHQWLAEIRNGLDDGETNEIIVLGGQESTHIRLSRQDVDHFLAAQKRKVRWQGRLYQTVVICLVGAIAIIGMGVYQKQIENILASEHYAKIEAERDAIEQALSLYTEFTRDIVGEHHGELSTILGELGTNTSTVVNAGADTAGTGGFGSHTEGVGRILSEHIDPATARNLHEIARVQEFFDRLPSTEPLKASHLTSGFGMREHPVTGYVVPHRGIDLVSWDNPTVFSSGAGRVTFAGENGKAGNMVTIDHGSAIESRYFHLNSIAVEVGDFLEAGDAVGVMGDTGETDGAHLHYEVRVAGKHLDPENIPEVIGYVD